MNLPTRLTYRSSPHSLKPRPPQVGLFTVLDDSVVVVLASTAGLSSVRGAVWDMDDGAVADSYHTPVPRANAHDAPVQVLASTHEECFVLALRFDSQTGGSASGPGSCGV